MAVPEGVVFGASKFASRAPNTVLPVLLITAIPDALSVNALYAAVFHDPHAILVANCVVPNCKKSAVTYAAALAGVKP